MTNSEPGGRSGVESKTEVRRLRNASTRAPCCVPSRSIRCQDERASLPVPFPLSTRALSCWRNLWIPCWSPFDGGTTGIKAKDGRPNSRSTSSSPLSVLSIRSWKNAAQTPSPNPRNAATIRFSAILGLTGLAGGSAESTMRMLLAFRLAETPASFSRCSRPS